MRRSAQVPAASRASCCRKLCCWDSRPASLGLAFTQAAIGLLRRMAPARLPRVDEIGIDPTVLLFTLAISLLSGVLFGLVPMVRFGAVDATALKEGGRSTSDAPARLRTRNALVVAEVALALVLLIVSGLMIRTFVAMRQVHPGFTRPEEVQTFQLAIPEDITRNGEQFARTHEQIARRLEQVPGVVSVGLSSSITMDGEDNTNPLFVEHVEVPEGRLPPLRRFKSVAPGYFETMGNPLVAGRAITWDDIYRVRPVVLISETLAREYWRSPANALGKRVRGFGPTWYEVVGVVGQERDDGLNQPATADRVLADAQRDLQHATSSPTPCGRLAWAHRGSSRSSAGRSGRSNPTSRSRPYGPSMRFVADSMAQTSFAMVMLAIAGCVALLLGAVGIYGVIAYIAAQRTREIGIRIALGAQPADVLRMVLAQGLVLAGAGIAIGLVGAWGATRVMRCAAVRDQPHGPAHVCRRGAAPRRGGAAGMLGAGSPGDARGPDRRAAPGVSRARRPVARARRLLVSQRGHRVEPRGARAGSYAVTQSSTSWWSRSDPAGPYGAQVQPCTSRRKGRIAA